MGNPAEKTTIAPGKRCIAKTNHQGKTFFLLFSNPPMTQRLRAG